MILNNLGWLYCVQGRYAESEEKYKQALDLKQKLLGTADLEVATSLNNIGILFNK